MTTDFKVSQTLYEALKSMAESYDLAIQCTPPGVPRDSFIGYFVGTKKKTDEALAKFETVKARKATEDHSNYMIKIMEGVPVHFR